MLFHGLMVYSSILLSSIQVQRNHNLITHLSVGGPLAYFHILKFMYKFLWEHMFSVVMGMYLWVELLYHMVNGNPLQYFCLENPMDKRSLVGYSPWGHKESGTTERPYLLTSCLTFWETPTEVFHSSGTVLYSPEQGTGIQFVHILATYFPFYFLN